MENELIYKYIKSLVNLYGIVSRDKVIEIYNMQNDKKIGLPDIDKVIIEYLKSDSFFVMHKDYFIEESVEYEGSLESLKKQQENKPHYIPEREELLKYEDDLYYEITPEYKKLKAFVKKDMVNGDDELAEEICDDIKLECAMDFSLDNVMQHFTRRDIVFKGEAQLNKLMQLIMDLANNTRIWENNGHTPSEIFEKYEKPNLRPLPKEPFDFQEGIGSNILSFPGGKKIGRNDPCPCGSGKKYKKCCLSKGSNVIPINGNQKRSDETGDKSMKILKIKISLVAV